MRLPIAFLVTAVSAAGACVSGDATDVVIRSDSAGIEVVISPAVDQTLEWILDRQFELGGESEGPESFYRVSAGSVAADAQGHLYVLDQQARRVVAFTAEGQFIRAFGQGGQGPGELQFPGALAVSANGDVAVVDYGRRGVVRYRSDGTVLDQVPLPSYRPPNQQRHIAVFEGGMLVTSQNQDDANNQTRHSLHAIIGADTTILAELSFPPPAGVRYPDCGGGLRLPRLFEAEISWSSSARLLLVSRTPGYDLELYSGPQLKRRFSRAVPLKEATRELALQELAEGFRIDFGQGMCNIPAAEMVDGRGFAPLVPWIQQVTLSPTGEAWVLRKEVGPNAQGPIDVFDSSGAYVGTFPQGTPFPLVFLDDHRFAAAETDELDITRLVVYTIGREGRTGGDGQAAG